LGEWPRIIYLVPTEEYVLEVEVLANRRGMLAIVLDNNATWLLDTQLSEIQAMLTTKRAITPVSSSSDAEA
jgi:hypothetical protein